MLSQKRKAELFDELLTCLAPSVRLDVAVLCHVQELSRTNVENLFREEDVLKRVHAFFYDYVDWKDYEYILRKWLPELIKRELDAKEVSITWE